MCCSGKTFGTITDIISGPGGMYVLSYTDGTLYRITNKPVASASAMAAMSLGEVVPEPGSLALWLQWGLPSAFRVDDENQSTECCRGG